MLGSAMQAETVLAVHSDIEEGLVSLRIESGLEQTSAARIAKLEAMVRERDELLRLLSVHAPVGFFQTDGAGRLIRTNARWREIARLSHIAAPRGVWWQMVDPGDRERVVGAWKAAVRHGCEFQEEFRTNTGAGWTCYVRTRIVPVIEEGGAVSKCIGVSEDITERRRLESALRRAHEDLERKVKERTAQLQAANMELGQFVHVVAHDLKAPLRAVSHLADWVASDCASQIDANGHNLLGLLRQRVQYMHDLIEGVLSYTRLGQTKEPEVELDLNALVRRVLTGLAPPSNIQVHIPSSLPRVRGVAGQLQRIFQNLLDNAIKFMDKPLGVITVRATRLRNAWQFAVADNGPGIEPRYHAQVFGLFERLRVGPHNDGTGIGLALVKRILEAKGGEITLDSAPGEGSVFTFTWPDAPVRLESNEQ